MALLLSRHSEGWRVIKEAGLIQLAVQSLWFSVYLGLTYIDDQHLATGRNQR